MNSVYYSKGITETTNISISEVIPILSTFVEITLTWLCLNHLRYYIKIMWGMQEGDNHSHYFWQETCYDNRKTIVIFRKWMSKVICIKGHSTKVKVILKLWIQMWHNMLNWKVSQTDNSAHSEDLFIFHLLQTLLIILYVIIHSFYIMTREESFSGVIMIHNTRSVTSSTCSHTIQVSYTLFKRMAYFQRYQFSWIFGFKFVAINYSFIVHTENCHFIPGTRIHKNRPLYKNWYPTNIKPFTDVLGWKFLHNNVPELYESNEWTKGEITTLNWSDENWK